MKKILPLFLYLFLCSYTQAQSFLGLYGTQNSITEIKENPAFTVSQDRVQINIASAGGDIGGNSILFRPHAFNFISTGNITSGQDYYRGYDTRDRNFFGSVEVMGPGASFKIKKKYSFAVTTGVRYLVNSDNLDAHVANILGAGAIKDTPATDSFKIHNYALTAQVFREINVSYAGYLYQSEEYNLVAGITLKVLTGAGAAGVGIADASFKTHNNDGVALNAKGNVNIAFSPYANDWAISNNPFRSFNNPTGNLGIGIDLGLVYYISPNAEMHEKKDYEMRLAVSVTDIGSISYTASSTTGSYSINNKSIGLGGVENNNAVSYGNRIFNQYLVDTVAKLKGTSSKFKVRLPTALHLNADFKAQENVYVNANLLLNMIKPSADRYANHYITTLTVTPRYMVHSFGIGLPFSYNAQQQAYLGAIVFMGPVYIGSGSLLQMATSNSINNISLYAGLTLRIKPKRDD